jgi:hypothetical protein
MTTPNFTAKATLYATSVALRFAGLASPGRFGSVIPLRATRIAVPLTLLWEGIR